MEDEVTAPLEEAAEERVPESARQIESLDGAERPAEEAQAAQQAAARIARDVQRVAEKLAGSGDFREILQRMEMILELQRRTIGETEKRIPKEGQP